MTWPQARTLLTRGKRVRRADWDNALRIKAGEIEFVTPVQVYGSTKDASYEPTTTDKTATDWVEA